MKDWHELWNKLTTPGTPTAMFFFGGLGLLIALLLLLIGFWKTLLVVCCCLVGCFVGGVKEKIGFLRSLLSRLIRQDD